MIKQTLNRLLLLLLAITSLNTAVLAQKIKEKDDIIYLDDKAVFKVFKDKAGAFAYPNYYILSMKGDSLFQLKGAGGYMPSFTYETLGPRFDCFMLFAKGSTDTLYTYYMMGAKSVASLLIENKLVADGQVSAEGLTAYSSLSSKVKKELGEFEARRARRKAVMADKAKMDKIAERKLPARNYADDLAVSYGKVHVGAVQVGTYQMDSDNNYGTSYRVFLLSGKAMGSIFYEKGKKRVFIRFFDDNESVEYFGVESFDAKELKRAVQYFTDLGYL